MRTTLNIDTELLVAAKELAERDRKTAGQVVSELLRQALRARGTEAKVIGQGYSWFPACCIPWWRGDQPACQPASG